MTSAQAVMSLASAVSSVSCRFPRTFPTESFHVRVRSRPRPGDNNARTSSSPPGTAPAALRAGSEPAGQLDARGDAELAVDVLDVRVDGAFGDDQPARRSPGW